MAISPSLHQREQDKFGGDSTDKTFVRTSNSPSSDFPTNVGLGLIEGAEYRIILGTNTIGEGAANESILADSFTGRYPFPSTAAQMTIVSTSIDDDSTGTGLQVLLVRGLIADGTELFEVVLLDGTSAVTTTNSYLRINSILGASVGSGGKNAGDITLKNGADLLAFMAAGDNVSEAAVYSIPSNVTGLIISSSVVTAKDDSAVTKFHIFLSQLGGIDFAALKLQTYQNQIKLGDKSTFTLAGGSDVEVTGFGLVGTGAATISGQFELLLIDD